MTESQMQREVDRLGRDDCVLLLEAVCIQCYDHEDIGTLREAVRVNIEDGTIPTYWLDARSA